MGTKTVKTEPKVDKKAVGVSRLIGPEDVRPGLWVTVSEATYRAPADGEPFGGGKLATVTWTTPACDAGEPYEVRAVALPFVYAIDAGGEPRTLDLRRHRLARLPKACGAIARRLAEARAGGA